MAYLINDPDFLPFIQSNSHYCQKKYIDLNNSFAQRKDTFVRKLHEHEKREAYDKPHIPYKTQTLTSPTTLRFIDGIYQ